MDASTFRARYGPWALVAGASEGIGEEYSRQIAARGVNLVLIARRVAGLEALAKELREAYGVEVKTLSLDLGRPDMINSIRDCIQGLEVGLLVYNACFSHVGLFLERDLEGKLTCLDVNCRGPLILTSELAPAMVARGRGGILLMSSASGFQGGSYISTYAATKAFNTVLAESLWEEFRSSGVDVLGMVAGATRTPTFDQQPPEEKRPDAFPMFPADVVREALNSLDKGPTRVAGSTNKFFTFLMGKMMSRRTAVRFIGNRLRKLYGEE
jgi:short-subunit dehydrogenase